MFRLGIHQLPEADKVFISHAIQSTSVESKAWLIVNAPPYDVLIVAESAPILKSPNARLFAKKILKVVNGYQPTDSCTLVKAVNKEHIASWLHAYRHNRAGESSHASTSYLAPPDGWYDRVKLHQWPPSAFLEGGVARLRVATMLSRRAMAPAELAVATRQPIGLCLKYVDELRGMQLLQEVRDCKKSTTNPLVVASSVLPAQAVYGGLISRIRKRLGLH